MPTTLPRHTVTETPDIAAILDSAATRYPGLSRQQLLRRVILEAGQVQQHGIEQERERLRERLSQTPTCLAVGGDAVADVRLMRDEEWA